MPSIPREVSSEITYARRRFHQHSAISTIQNELMSCFKGVLINFNPRWRWPGRGKLREMIEAPPQVREDCGKRYNYDRLEHHTLKHPMHRSAIRYLCAAHQPGLSPPRGVSFLISHQEVASSPKLGVLRTRQLPSHAEREAKKRERSLKKRPKLRGQGFRIQQPAGRAPGRGRQ